MRVVLDTNVIISGIFWKGPPHEILQLWHDREIELVVSLEILEEYHRVADSISNEFPAIDISEILELISLHSLLIELPEGYPDITVDPDDDKFVLSALLSGAKVVVSGDKHLLDAHGYQGIEILKPKQFLDRFF